MASTPEAVASRLVEFIDAERQAANRSPAMVLPEMRSPQAASAASRSDAKFFATCLRMLTNEERGELDRMLAKMLGALGPR